MKKRSIISLILICISMFAFAIFSACAPKTTASIEEINFKEGTVKSIYQLNEEIDYSTIKIIAKYDDQSAEELAITDADNGVTYSPIDTSTAGQKVLTATYKGKTATANVEVPKILSSIEFANLYTTYNKGDEIDYSNITIKFIYNDNSTETKKLNSTDFSYNEIDTDTLGTQKFTVSFGDKTISADITIIDSNLQSVSFKDQLLTFDFNSEFNKDKVQLNLVYDDATADKTITLADKYVTITQEVSLTDKTLIGQKQTLKVEYHGKTAEVEVIVNKVLTKIEFNEDVQTEYYLNSDVDYSTIFIILSYNDDTTEEIALTDNAVEFDKIDTSIKGTCKFKATYGELSTEELTITIISKLAPEYFTTPKAYQNYLTKSGDTKTFKIARDVNENPYLVGSVNKFSFVPQTGYFSVEILDDIPIANPLTVFTLYEKINGNYQVVESPAQYVTAKDNMYKFTSDANDKFFKMVIKLDETKYDLSYWTDDNVQVPEISIEFKVVDAYNAYDVFGLSVLDNLNVKNWAEIKNRTLKYDDKKLSEYTDVKLIVLHNDIVINANNLPKNYFWAEDMYGYDIAYQKAAAADALTNGKSNFAERLKGSLRNGLGGDTYNHCNNIDISKELNTLDINGNPRGDYAEEWNCQNVQKGIFNTNQTSLSGNYMTISTSDSATRHLTSILGHDYKEGDVDSMINQISHWSMFKFYKTDDLVESKTTVNLSLDNVILLGNMQKINEDGQEAGLMAMNTFIDKMTINNTITTQFYTHIVCDGGERGTCILEFNDSIMTDAYSNMFYLWRSNVTINRSTMKNAGGPLFILCDADRTTETTDGPVLNIDNESVLESYAAGTEAWYDMYDAQPLLNKLKGDINNLLFYTFGKTFVHNVNDVDQINIIAVMIPNPESIFSSPEETINIKGKVIRENTEIFDMDSTAALAIKTNNTVGFLSNNQFAMLTGTTTVTDMSDFNKSSSDMLTMILSAAFAGGASNAPYFGVVLGNYLNQKQNITI